MADEVQISDVLCEAMEYLSKLGSNLRARSESLKAKRIRKDKLKNSHAVQKAADKMLLICELSKKSLENVESGVRNVLSVLKDRYRKVPSAAEESSTSTKPSKKYQYIRYQSSKLKILKRVPVKHYMSVEVLVRNMPFDMHEKYPVYYNCKLYRLRKKQARKEFTTVLSDDDSNRVEDLDANHKTINDSHIETLVHSETRLNDGEKLEDDGSDNPSPFVKEGLSSSTDAEKFKDIQQNCDVKNSESKESQQPDSDKSTIMLEPNKTTSRNDKKRYKHIMIMDDSSEQSNDSLSKENKIKENEKLASTMIECNKNESICQKDESLKANNILNENNRKEIAEEVSTCEKKNEQEVMKYNCKESVVKPAIKCVSISTLLKPDVLKKSAECIISKNKQKDKTKIQISSNTLHKKQQCVDNVAKHDEEYWTCKRKEIEAFVPKQFSIKIDRLPNFTANFLHLHSLKKIVYRQSVIYELLQDKNSSEMCHNAKSDAIHTIKNNLLNDSESEKSDSNNDLPLDSANVTEETSISKNKTHNSADNIHDLKSVKQCSDELRTDKTDINSKIDSLDNKRLTDKKALPNDSEKEIDDMGVENSNLNNETNPKGTLSPGLEDASHRKNVEDHTQDINTVEILNKNKEQKAALLNDSESDKAESNTRVSKSGSDSGPKHDIEPSEEQKDNRKSISKDSDNVTALACNDEMKTPPRKKRKYSDGSTPRSKRKRIMESMHAKKMLLTYSSSSETEDEQLKNVLKDIKDELLKGISSGDEKEDNQEKRNSPIDSSSGSDEDILEQLNSIKKSKMCIKKKKQGKISSHTDISDENSEKMGRSRPQPGGSSQNSDSQDPNEKDIEGLSNLKSLMKNRQRRNYVASDDTSDSNSLKKVIKMSKTPLINEDNMLKAESSSDAASAGESDAPEVDEELPSVPLSNLNGTGGGHLAKDDLLGESDTSTSHQEKEEEQKDSEDDENVKSKRRKMNAISSDSEVGSSRKKDRTVKLSDFEDSDYDTSEPGKKNKRKNNVDESDASIGSSSNDGSKKKRRRIKTLDDDSEGSGSDTENEGRNKHGRKNIRKVMSKNQLEEATKKAARQEKERIARIAERQKLYNNLEFDESGKPDEVVLEKVVLDFDPETKEPLIEVDRGLVKKLKPHQANGIKFMWDACFESVKRIKKDRGSGCILAHCMGLGKTLQVVSLTHTLLTHSDLTKVNRVLVVCPLSTVLNWVNEFKMWLKHSVTDYEVDVYELSRYKQNSERAFQLQQWFENGGVCVLGYEMFRNLSADNPKKFKKKMLKNFQEALVEPGPDLVVCDEGHLLKNEKTSLSQSMNRVRTLRRIVLTGTPLQNNLKEYYCMVQFVKPNLLGKYNEYLNRFVNPITNGQYTDSTEHDIRIMKRRSHVLHKMLDGAVQRRDYGVLAPFLPPKHEYVLFITLTEVQIKLYDYYLEKYSRRPLPGKSSGFLFPDFQSLQRIWTHPLVLKYNSERYEIMQQKKREREEEEDSEGSLVDFIDDDSTPDESSTDDSSEDLSDASDDSRKKSKKKKSVKKSKGKESKMSTRRGTRANPGVLVEMEEVETTEVAELKAENPTEWWIKLVTDDEVEDMRYSHKLILLFEILRQCETIGDKLLVFSQSLYSLDLIEHFLGKVDEATQEGRIDEKLGGHVGSWSPGVDYFRLDGSTSCENRSIWCKNFNREDNPRARLFLISTRAGGLGINLVAANRVVIFDVSWNPSHDVQSIFRVYRFGQKKPCYIYRFLAMGTMEEKIYERQVTKQAISKRVIDEQQIDRHYAENDLAELYKFEPRPPAPRPLPPLPRDRLFAEMLREREAQIYKYHEHDSLLENKEEETLSEEERKAAWEDFENEKNRPPPAPFPNAWQGMMPGLLAQQQQLAYAALAAMLRKDMPNMNDNQIRDMLPLIYNANPAMFGGYDYGLMQKMAEIYKYAPGAMMNPAMLNPVMNPAGGVGGGVGGGGSSGLQYSPPWQRQQQQQQMRLQQLMQHQNQMGAKYYAGGLGSRDPVAMALQQQRAREIMAGEQRRPRGRPPAPAPPAADVVNLDSD